MILAFLSDQGGEHIAIRNQTKDYVNHIKVARAILCLVVLIVSPGCTISQNSAPGKSWSQIAGEEEREQELRASSQDDWSRQP